MANQIQTVEEKLLNLYQLQFVTSQLDEVIRLQGELPMEVRDIEDELEGLTKRKQKFDEQIQKLESEVSKYDESIDFANSLIVKYKKQLDDVKNNREYEALSKEVEYQSLDVKLAEKKISETKTKTEEIKISLTEIESSIDDKKVELEKKKVELEGIIQKTEKKIGTLERKISRLGKSVEERLLNAFYALRKRYGNGLAIVTITRNACGGCFNAVPPQMQIEIAQNKEIVACENCGRVLISDELATQIDKKERSSEIENFPRRKAKRTLEFE